VKIPFCPLEREPESLRRRVALRWKEIQNTGQFLKGPQETELLQRLAHYLGADARQLVLVGSGTDALILSLLALDIGKGDIVLTSAVSAAATASAVQAVGANVKYVDIDPASGLLFLPAVKAKLCQRVKAVIPVHLYGNRVNTFVLRSQLDEWGYSSVAIVEDGAQSFGSSLNGGKIVSTSHFHTFSFYPTKNLGSWGDGGLVWCASQDFAEKISALAFYGQRERNLSIYSRGINSRMDEWQVAVLLEKFSDLEGSLRLKKEYLKIYKDRFQDFPISFPQVGDGVCAAWHLAVAKFPNLLERNSIQRLLAEVQIETLVHYPFPLPMQKGLKEEENFPEAVNWCESILSLPLTACHSREEIERVAHEVVKNFAAFSSTQKFL